ncbi:bud site selection BUD4-like isoform X1 [Solea senegalensis]|uniref:Bud site selection BUD4-like isoform X1 n=2 Tax=Solea senegalensis TaxID=28829 RepID=A0AAV6QJQ1_SOLSE|nr:bud site selection BUD4-like isoform X1 [Solea senegalensis]
MTFAHVVRRQRRQICVDGREEIMSSQRTKKRFGSHRRVANQNETPKTDEIHATGNSNVAQHHIPEENIESLCVQSNSDNMPSPELRANRRKLGSRRKNKGQHERDLAAELSDKSKEEVENSPVNEALETQLAVHSERQEELCESHEHEMSATSDNSLYSAVMSAYCGVQNYTNCPEDIPENQQVEQDEDELDSKLMSSSNFVEPMREGAQDNAPLIGSSERVLSSQPGVSCVTEIEEKKWSEDADLLQQEGNLKSKESHEEMTTDKSNTTQHNKLVWSTDPAAAVSSSKDEQNEQFSQTQHSSVGTEERDVNTTVNRRKLGSSRKNKRQQRVEDSVARPYHETKVVKNLRGYGDSETSNMSSLETAVQLQPVDMMEEMDKPDNHQNETLIGEVKEITHTVGISDLYNPSLPTVSASSVTDAGSKESDENQDLFRHWGGSEAGNLVASTENFNPGQDTEYEQSVEQTADSSPKHEISTNKEDEQFCISEVGRAQDVDNAVKLMHNEDVKPAATQEMYFVDYSSESVIHDGTEDSEICSISPTNLTEVGDSYQSELSVKSNGDCATKQGLLSLDEEQDECLTQDNNVVASDQKNEDSAVYDPRNTQTSDIQRIDPAVEGWLEDDIKSVVEQSSDHEEEGLSEPMENKTPQTLQSETHSPLESQPHDNSGITDKQSEMSLMMETAVQEMSEETMLEGNDRFDPAHTEGVSDQAKENAQELTSTSEHSGPPVDQQTTEQSNSEQIPQEPSSVYSVTDTESKEGDEDNDLLKQWGNLQSNNLENETHFKSDDVESSVTPDITTEEGNHEEPTEPECRVEQATDPSPKDETSTKDEQIEPYSGALDTKDAVTKVQKEDVKETALHQVDCSSDEASKYSQSLQSEIEPSLDLQPNDSSQNIKEKIHTGFKPAGNKRKLGSSRRYKERQHVPDSVTESVIHDGTEDSVIGFVNLTDQTEVSDSYQSESSAKSKATCANKQEVSNPEEKQDTFLNVDTLDQINEDLNAYDLQKTQTSDIEGVDPAEDDIKSTVEQSSEYEEEGVLSELVENKTLQTLQSETHSPLESQPHDYSVTTDKQDNTENSEELGSVHVNEGEQNVSSSGAESEMSLTMETAVQEMSAETMLEGKDRFDPAHTEGVSDQAKENAQASASELTSSNSEPIPQELSSVYSVTDTESKEGDEDNDLLKHLGNLQSNNLENETHFKSEDVESSITPDITTEEGNHEEPTEPECRVEQATDPSPKDETSTKDEQSEPYSGALDTKDAVTKVQKEDVKETALHQVDCSSDEASKYSQSSHTRNRRKLGSSRRHKERQHVPVTEAYSELKEEVVKAIQGDEVSEKEKMASVTETMRQDILQEQIGLDFNPTEKMSGSRSTIKDKENAEQMPQEDTTLQPQNVESSATVSKESDDIKSTEQVNELEKKLITEPKDLSPPTGHDTIKTDLRESADASDLKHCDDTDADNTEADLSVGARGPEQVEVSEICADNTSNKNVPCALVDTGHEETSRPKPAVNMSEESETPAASNSQQGAPTKPPVRGNVQGTRRKMGSTRKSQLNRKQMYDTDETKENNVVQSGERNNDSMGGVEESSLILTKDVSQRRNTHSNVTEEQQKMNENNSVHAETPKQQSCTLDLQATECNVIPGTDDSTVLSPEQAAYHTEEAVHPVRSVHGADEKDNEEKVEASVEVTQGPGSIVTEAPAVALADMEKMKSVVSREAGEHLKNDHVSVQEPNSVTDGAQNTNFEMMNANFSPANRRRKMGSTRRNLGSRSREKDLYQKQEEDNEVTATIRAGDASTESVIAKEPQLHDENTHSDSEQRKETVVETVECSHTCESHVKPPALENIEETPGPLSQPAGMEPRLTPEPRTSPKHDATSESAAGGRRRKMGSHRKSHPRQNAKDQIVGEDRLMDTQQEGDITPLTDERDKRREESLGLDRLSEVDKRDEKPTSNISISGAAEHSQILSEKAPKRVTPVPRPDAGIHLNQEIQNNFSSGAASSKSRVFNVLLVGDSSVGKTSFLKRAQSGKFSSDLPPSVGIDSCRWTVVVDGKPVALQLWDTAGQERFRSITRQVFHRAQAFLLMYDVTSSQSFSAVNYWANCIQEGAAENVTILLLGNKSDCAERQIQPEEGETLSKEYNFDFMECSAATGENVIQTLETVARMLKQNADTREESMVLHKEPPHKKRSGCC